MRSETHFKIGELTYKLFDVGGQRSERRKWLNIFDSVTALVFLIAISECGHILHVFRLIADFCASQMIKSCTKTSQSIVCKKPWHSLNPSPTLDGSPRPQLSSFLTRSIYFAKSCQYHLYQILSPSSEEVMTMIWLALSCSRSLWGWIIALQRVSMLITQMPPIPRLWSSSYLLSSEQLDPSVCRPPTNRSSATSSSRSTFETAVFSNPVNLRAF